MIAPSFQDRDERCSAQFSRDGNEPGVFEPAEGAIFGVSVEAKF